MVMHVYMGWGESDGGRERVAGCSSQYVFVTDTHSYICHIWERYVWSGRSGEEDYRVVGMEGNNDFIFNFIFYFSGMQMAEDVSSITGEKQLSAFNTTTQHCCHMSLF
jgi:hypothetical protein